MPLPHSSQVDLILLAPVVGILIVSHFIYLRKHRNAAKRQLRLGCGFVVQGPTMPAQRATFIERRLEMVD